MLALSLGDMLDDYFLVESKAYVILTFEDLQFWVPSTGEENIVKNQSSLFEPSIGRI